MTLFEFLSDRLGRIVLQGLCAGAAALFLLATGTQPGVLLLLLLVLFLVFLGGLAWDFLGLRRRLGELTSSLDSLDQKYLFAECLPRPASSYEAQLFALLRRAGKAMIERVSDAQAAQRAYRAYVEQWVHEIKTPITAARLVSQSLPPGPRRKLDRELTQIDAHVERALFYARTESPEKDVLIRRPNLADLVDQALQAHRTLLIEHGVRVEVQGLDHTVYTDSKWAGFLLGQLLQNAARYHSDQPVVTLSAQAMGSQVRLTVADNGIGIPAHELPRIFDRGFTGSNGRSRGGSTGMGLYLAKKLAETLEISLRAVSVEGEGTQLTLTFPAQERLTKL